jgi:putative methyltransferase (TIGR04325 family)
MRTVQLAELVRKILRRRRRPRTLRTYGSFAEALSSADGYEDPPVIEVVSRKTQALRSRLTTDGARAPVSDRQTLQNVFVLSYIWTGTPLTVLDVGGACGANYFLLDHLLPGRIASWHVLETAAMAAAGRKLFHDERLRFWDDLDEALRSCKCPDLLIASGVLQCLPSPLQALEAWFGTRAVFLYLTRNRVLVGDDGFDGPLFTKHVTDLASHGPGPLPKDLVNARTSQAMTVLSCRALVSAVSPGYSTEFTFEEAEAEPTRVGSREVRIGTVGFLLKRRPGQDVTARP